MAKVERQPNSAPARWHSRLARVTGEISLCIGRRRMTRGQVIEWLQELRSVADEMDEVTSAKDNA